MSWQSGILRRTSRERDQALEAFKGSQELYRHIVENAHEMMFDVDANGRVTYVNKAGEYYMEAPASELLGQLYTDFIPPSHRASAHRYFVVQVARKTPVTYYEAPARSKSGKIVWFGQNVRLKFDGDMVTGFQIISRDVTQRRIAEEQLKERETTLRVMFDQTPLGMVLLDANGTIIDANSVMAGLLGYSKEGLLQKVFTEITYPEDLIADVSLFHDLREGRRNRYQIEKRYLRNDGSVFWGRLSVAAFRGKEKASAVAIGMLEDIDERKKSDEANRKLMEELREALAEVKTLSGMLPICSGCKKIRDDSGYWNRIESYIESHTGAQFSHGLCPDCMGTYFPGFQPSVSPSSENMDITKEEKSL